MISVVLARLRIVLVAERKWTSVLRHVRTPLRLSTSCDVGEKPDEVLKNRTMIVNVIYSNYLRQNAFREKLIFTFNQRNMPLTVPCSM